MKKNTSRKARGKNEYGAYRSMHSPLYGVRNPVKGSVPEIPFDDYETMNEVVNSLPVAESESSEMYPFAVFIGNELERTVGRWIALPADDTELSDLQEATSFNWNQDWAIADYETHYSAFYDWMRGQGIDTLQETATQLHDVDEEGITAIGLILKAGIAADIEEALSIVSGYSGSMSHYDSKMDAAYETAEEMESSRLAYYVDEEMYVRDMSGGFYEGSDLWESYGGDEAFFKQNLLDELPMQSTETMLQYLDWEFLYNELRHDYSQLEADDGSVYLIQY